MPKTVAKDKILANPLHQMGEIPQSLFSAYSSRNLATYLRVRKILSADLGEKFKERIQRHRAHGKDGHHFIFGVFDKRTGGYVGQIDFFTINKQLRWANIGYHIQNQHFGKRYATEAGRLALRIAFDSLGFHRVEAGTELGNKASQKVAIRIGLKPEGIRRKFFPDNGGIDMHFYANNAFDFK